MDVTYSPGLPRGFSFEPGNPRNALDLGPAAPIYGAAMAAAIDGRVTRPLCGGFPGFAACTAYLAREGRVTIATAPLDMLVDWAAAEGPATARRVGDCLDILSAPRAAFAGLPGDQPVIFGIVNATPDSFSDGGRFLDPAAAIDHGHALIEAGADALDIGGESTRPGARPATEEAERDRVVPVIEGLAGCGVPLSVDTRHAGVMRAALDAGARIVNDVSALTDDAHAIDLVAARAAPAVLMHKRGEPETMGDNAVYAHAPYEVYLYLKKRVAACVAAGIAPGDIAVDPGFGFAKTPVHNRQLLADIGLLHGLGCVVMAGASRKFGTGRADRDRLGGSLAAASWAASWGVQLFRVHDVAETRQALRLVTRMVAGD